MAYRRAGECSFGYSIKSGIVLNMCSRRGVEAIHRKAVDIVISLLYICVFALAFAGEAVNNESPSEGADHSDTVQGIQYF